MKEKIETKRKYSKYKVRVYGQNKSEYATAHNVM